MEIPNINCKWCEHVADVTREHCKECLFSLYEVLSSKPKEKEKETDTLTDIDWEFCMWCWYKYNQPDKCNGCIWNKTPLATE